ncbi:MAG: hypothetical protein SFU27_03265 [Thermonemataceae bacterium]|nr:hypothetical protein [Thermonemataceae bacterium]
MNTEVLQLRPRFRFHTEMTQREIMDSFQQELTHNNPDNFSAILTDYHIHVSFPKETQRLWTPTMEISMEKNLQNNETLVRVLLAPASNIWMIIMFFTITTSTAVFIGLMLGISQLMIDNEPWAFYVIPIGIAFLTFLYLSARQGRELARKEMPRLKKFADQVFHCDCIMKSDTMQQTETQK